MDPFPFDDYAYLDFFFKDLEIVSYVRDVKFGVMDLLGKTVVLYVLRAQLTAFHYFSVFWWLGWTISWLQFDQCDGNYLLFCEDLDSLSGIHFWLEWLEVTKASQI